MLPKPWPLDHALRKVEELCAIHEANVTIALSVSDSNRIEKKTGRPSSTRVRPVERRTGVSGVRGHTDSTDKRGAVQLVPKNHASNK